MKLILALVFSSMMGWAQHGPYAPNDPAQSDYNNLRQEGRMVSIHVVPKNPIRIFVVGREEAQFDLSKLKLTARRLSPKPEKSLGLVKEGDHYIFESATGEEPTDFEVTAKTPKKTETFHFKIKNQMH